MWILHLLFTCCLFESVKPNVYEVSSLDHKDPKALSSSSSLSSSSVSSLPWYQYPWTSRWSKPWLIQPKPMDQVMTDLNELWFVHENETKHHCLQLMQLYYQEMENVEDPLALDLDLNLNTDVSVVVTQPCLVSWFCPQQQKQQGKQQSQTQGKPTFQHQSERRLAYLQSKYECATAFHLELSLSTSDFDSESESESESETNDMELIQGQTPYKAMIERMDSMQERMKTIIKRTPATETDYETKTLVLESMHQRLSILKQILFRLYDVVMYDARVQLYSRATKPSIHRIHSYFTHVANEWATHLVQLNQSFPEDMMQLVHQFKLHKGKQMIHKMLHEKQQDMHPLIHRYQSLNLGHQLGHQLGLTNEIQWIQSFAQNIRQNIQHGVQWFINACILCFMSLMWIILRSAYQCLLPRSNILFR